jgi:D-hexose-6-phosphate mutarotase
MGTDNNSGQGIKLPEGVTLTKGSGGLPIVSIKAAQSAAEIYLHGAHVTHFQKQGEAPLLWMSAKSKFDEASAIRGGIPVIFPWFGGRTGCPAHGFARVKNWILAGASKDANGAVTVHLHLPETNEAGFANFEADYFVTVSEVLEVKLTVTNKSSSEEFKYEDCLHSYFTIGDIGSVAVKGLKGVRYLDKVDGGAEKTETNDAIVISSEVDRVYMDTKAAVEIHDGKLHRKILVEKTGSAATVVWNPWIAKSKAMADFGDEEYHTMVCVESGNVGKNSVTLAPGKSATLTARLSSMPL